MAALETIIRGCCFSAHFASFSSFGVELSFDSARFDFIFSEIEQGRETEKLEVGKEEKAPGWNMQHFFSCWTKKERNFSPKNWKYDAGFFERERENKMEEKRRARSQLHCLTLVQPIMKRERRKKRRVFSSISRHQCWAMEKWLQKSRLELFFRHHLWMSSGGWCWIGPASQKR